MLDEMRREQDAGFMAVEVRYLLGAEKSVIYHN